MSGPIPSEPPFTGPPYPRPLRSGIGTHFSPGITPIGTIPRFDYWNTIISQYANSPILTQLITNFFGYVDQTENMDDFFDDIWDIVTAKGYGLDVWGRIVGVQRTLFVGSSTYFGFEEAMSWQPFGQAPFFGGALATNNFALSDEAFRKLILAKAFANICDGSINAINTLLLTLFPGRGNCFATDGLNMTMTYTFQFALTLVELAILTQSGVLPKPVGVSATVVHP